MQPSKRLYGGVIQTQNKIKCITDEADAQNIDLTDEAYFTTCFHYIHNNPVAAGLVTEPGEWKWSSYRFYSGKREKSFCNKELAHKFLGIEKLT